VSALLAGVASTLPTAGAVLAALAALAAWGRSDPAQESDHYDEGNDQ
jgi:hypothetical protein